MRKLLALSCTLLALTTLHAAPPSKESVEKLLVVTEVEKLLGSMTQQLEASMKNMMEQAFRGQKLPPEARDLSDRFQQKIMANLMAEMSWDKMKSLYLQVYSETFTQEEIDGLVAFYVSPAGKAFVAKMPVVMQKSMSLMQERMGPLMQKTQEAMKEAVQEVEAITKKASVEK